MTILKLLINHQTLKAQYNISKLTENIKDIKVEISYTEDWENMEKKVFFTSEKGTFLMKDDKVPLEVIQVPGFKIYVVGYDNLELATVRITSFPVNVFIYPSEVKDENP